MLTVLSLLCSWVVLGLTMFEVHALRARVSELERKI